jgi:hypothetical protein
MLVEQFDAAAMVLTDGQARRQASGLVKEGHVIIFNCWRQSQGGGGAYPGFKDIDSLFLELINTKVSEQAVAVELDETKKNFLCPEEDTEAARTGWGCS